MLLLQLPPETLGLIFKQIGSGFFQEDIKRLTICKRWYEFALAECLRRVILTVDSLKHLVRAGIFEPPSALIGSCQILGLYLGGNRSTSHNEDSRMIQAEASQEGGLADRYALDHDLTQLATLTQRSRKLYTLHIQAWSFPLGPLEIRSLDVLTGKTMILDDNAAWDQDGRFPEEFSASESELSDDALAAFLDSDED
ncbi:hypothetical protein V2A60_006095 [Cordyceps javanica]